MLMKTFAMKTTAIGIVLFSLLGPAIDAFYDSSSNVVELTPNNFESRVINSDEVWIVEFYAPWCGHCQSLVPEYTKVAKALLGVVKVGSVNADEHKTLGGKYGVQGFPTIKIFGHDKSKPQDYQGARSLQGFIDAAFKALRAKVDAQSGGRSSGGSGSSGDSGDVVELTDSNFDKLVLNSDDVWLVEFFAPWCGHCKNLAPHWAKAATQLKGKVKLGALDSTVHTMTAGKYNIRGYPTIKYFPGGSKSGGPQDYEGGRTADDIVAWASDKVTANIPPPEIQQIINEKVLKSSCDDHQLCIISILPHILDCQSECRNQYISTLLKVGEKFKKNQWGWVWAEAGAQLDLEESLGVGGFGYPAMAAVNTRKAKFALLKGSFGFDGINEFVRELAVGRGSTLPLKGAALPKVATTEPWDGKDGKLELEEDEYGDLDKSEL